GAVQLPKIKSLNQRDDNCTTGLLATEIQSAYLSSSGTRKAPCGRPAPKREITVSKYRNRLPQMNDGVVLTDGGLETTLIFHKQIELPHFAAFDLLRDAAGREALRQYYLPYIESARRNGCGFILDSATWRANPDWGSQLGYSKEALAAVNRDGIDLLLEL